MPPSLFAIANLISPDCLLVRGAPSITRLVEQVRRLDELPQPIEKWMSLDRFVVGCSAISMHPDDTLTPEPNQFTLDS